MGGTCEHRRWVPLCRASRDEQCVELASALGSDIAVEPLTLGDLHGAREAVPHRYRPWFLHESELAASIDHPNIIPIYEAGEEDGCLFIAMRYVEGSDLGALLRDGGALAPGRSLEVVGQVADALDVAHASGLVHRDIKPSNVLVDARGHCYLCDFGLTRRASDRVELVARGRIAGTVDYIAPEQLRGDNIDGRADVYSLGCLLFECLTGEVPFVHDTEVAVIYAQLEEQARSASERRHDLQWRSTRR